MNHLSNICWNKQIVSFLLPGEANRWWPGRACVVTVVIWYVVGIQSFGEVCGVVVEQVWSPDGCICDDPVVTWWGM